MATSKPLLVVFDFDNTIVDDNTDTVVKDLLSKDIPESVKALYMAGAGWTACMRKIFELLHEKNISRQEIIAAIEGIPATPGFEELLKHLYENNCEVIIISDANSVFIETWLKYKKLDHIISKTYTNPAFFDNTELLHIEMCQSQNWCKLCEKNLCKGSILENYVKQRFEDGVTFGNLAYVGDGSNDFCPMLKLPEKDTAFPRENYPIIKLLNAPGSENVVRAKVTPWKNGIDIWEALTRKIHF